MDEIEVYMLLSCYVDDLLLRLLVEQWGNIHKLLLEEHQLHMNHLVLQSRRQLWITNEEQCLNIHIVLKLQSIPATPVGYIKEKHRHWY